MLVTGGGGYTKTNVARCWTNETATLLDQELDPKLPSTVFDEYFVSDPTLRLDARDGAAEEHANKAADLDALLRKVLQNLDELRTAPAVCMHVRGPLVRLQVQYFLLVGPVFWMSAQESKAYADLLPATAHFCTADLVARFLNVGTGTAVIGTITGSR
jgi:hypothetical protein